MKTIVCNAQPFGFGPVSKLLAIIERLHDVRKIFFGTSVAYDFAKLHDFDEIHYVENYEEEHILEILRDADVFLNVMNFPMGKLAHIAGCHYMLVDSLLWFWPAKPEGVEYADIYFCQNFFSSVESKVKEYGFANAAIIGPIVSDNFVNLNKKEQIIVNFGGCDGKVADSFIEVGVNNTYPLIVLRNLLPILQECGSNILVTGREKVMELCRASFSENKTLQFRMLDNKTMRQEICQSKALFTIAGIQSFFDSAEFVPIFFLPPLNHSHVRNLDIFVEQGIAEHFLRWNELYDFPFSQCKTRQERINLVLEKINLFDKDETGQRFFQNKVKAFLDFSHSWTALIQKQKEAFQKLGADGVETIVEHIYHTLSKAEAMSLTSAE